MTSTQSATAVVPGELERGRPLSADELRWRGDWIRIRVVELIANAGLGHYSSSFSCAELFAGLYYHALRLRPSEPGWADRDRFLLGKGHSATALWPVLADLDFFPAAWLDDFGKVAAKINDHPNMKVAPGIDFSSGALGHNLSVGVGMAIGARIQGRDFRTVVVTGDGELQEGQVWEAIMAGSHYHLGNLVAIVDANGFSGGGATSAAMNIEPLADRFAAFGWSVVEIDGHDPHAVLDTFDAFPDPASDKPTCVIARTVKGKGLRMTEQAPQAWHLGHMTDEQQTDAVREIKARMA